MARRALMPPLTALLVFEAAGRHLNMSQAARELHMTQGAVSQQVRALEAYLAVALFHRTARGLTLTAAGRRLLDGISPSFSSIVNATDSARRIATSNTVILSTVASLAAWWLLPRLAHFDALLPDVTLHLEISRRPVQFDAEDVDLAIRYGQGHWAGVTATRLAHLRIACVCAPQALPDAQSLGSRIAEGRSRLLLDPAHDYWTPWAERHRLDPARLRDRMVTVDDMNVLIQALMAGYGAGLVPLLLVAEELKSGKLLRIHEDVLSIEGGYWLVHPAQEPRKSVRRVMDWIVEEMTTAESQVDALLA